MKFTTQEGMNIMTKLTKDQQALVERAQALEGLNVHIEERTSASGVFEYVTVWVDFDREWYDLGQRIVLTASRFRGERARQSAYQMFFGIGSHDTRDLKIREVRFAVESMWYLNTEAGKQERARYDALLGR